MVHDSSRQFQECHQKSYRFPPLTCPANPFFGHERFLRRTDLRSSRKSPWSLERSGRTVGTRATRRCFENWGFFESWSLFIPLYCNKVLRVLQKHLVLTYASISIFQVDCIISKVRFCKNSPPVGLSPQVSHNSQTLKKGWVRSTWSFSIDLRTPSGHGFLFKSQATLPPHQMGKIGHLVVK